MAQSERTRQAQLARKKQKKAARSGSSSRAGKKVLNPMMLSDARALVIREALINADWRETGEARILIAREVWTRRSTLIVAAFRVDLLARGVVEAWATVDVPVQDYDRKVVPDWFDGEGHLALAADEAAALLYAAVKQARVWGFAPVADWAVARLVVPAPDRAAAGFDVPLGRGGRPCLRLDEGQDAAAFRAVLDASVGADGYDVEGRPATETDVPAPAPIGTTPPA